MLIDTHAHLWFDDFHDDLEQVLGRAQQAGVEKIIMPGTDIESSRKAIELAKRYPGRLYAAVGVHPEDVDVRFRIHNLKDLIVRNREQVVAIGEIGTDASTAELKKCIREQQELLRQQCELAIENNLPIVLHSRQSLAETLEVIDHLPSTPRGQFHCFSHDVDGLEAVLKRGFYVSFCANITWSKRVAKLVPLVTPDRLLLETDSPFMAPGKRNEPANVRITAELIAELRGVTLEELGQQTSQNATRLFNL